MRLTLCAALAFLVLFSSCKKDDFSSRSLPEDVDLFPGPSQSDFSSEFSAETRFETHYLPFYHSRGVAGVFKNPRDPSPAQIAYRLFENPSAKSGIVLLPGRTEPILKYAELIYDLFQQGFSVYIISHRGQGESDHLISNDPNDPKFQIGHIESYRQYTEDLDYFLNSVVDSSGKKSLFLFAHSMGGAIAANYNDLHPGRFKAIVLSSPMLEINSKPYGASAGLTIVQTVCNSGKGKDYAIGQKGFVENAKFDPVDSNSDNQVTHSESRFAIRNKIFATHPSLKLGGASNNWVCEWLGQGTALARAAGRSNQAPTLLFQASQDLIVNPGGQNEYCSRSRVCQIYRFEGAYHEILQEKDEYRNLALSRAVKWMKRYEN